MPKKLNPDNNFKIEGFFGNMIKDSRKQENFKKSEDKIPKYLIEKSKSKEKEAKKKQELEKSPKIKKEKVKLSIEEIKEEKRQKSKPKKSSIKNDKIQKEKENNDDDIEIEEKSKSKEKEKGKNDKNNNKNKKKKKLIKKKVISDSESSYNISNDLNNKDEEDVLDLDFSDYKMDQMEIEEEEKDHFNKSKSKSKSKSNSKKNTAKQKKKSEKEDNIFEEDIDFEKLKYDMDEEEEKEKKEKEKKDKSKSSSNKSNKKSSNSSVIKSTRKKSRDKSTSINKKSRRDTSSSNSKNVNIIEGPLSDETIVITGEFDIKRDELSNILKSLGARVTGSVSSRTTILLHGNELEDGRPVTEGRKYRQAQEKGIIIMDRYQFEEHVQKITKNPNWSLTETEDYKIDPDLEIKEEISNDDESLSKTGKNHKKNKSKSKSKSSSNNNTLQNQGELWTTKYSPKKLSDLIGNKSTINKLITWLDDWNSVVLEGNTKKVETKFHWGQRPTFENINARACLITGDPGIGKTSSVRLIANLKGYNTYETNASDQRNKNLINKNAGFVFDNKTLFKGELKDKNLIIMDEIDGMSGNEDRGGIAAIIDIIKKTKIPIICIANDRQSPKLKTLVNYCYDLKFVHPDKRAIALRLSEICKKENINYEINALEYLCEICGNDIRQIINFMELWTRKNKSIKFKDLTGGKDRIQGKDEVVMLKNFDAAKELLSSKSHSKTYRELLDLYFIDYDLIPLLIQENYLSTFPSQNFKSSFEELENVSLAADLISLSDVIDKKIRTQMDWRLLADRGLIGCCTICKINKGFVPFPKFPEAMGKISSLNKKKREIVELKECFHSASNDEIRRDILPVIYTQLLDLISEGDIENVLNMMKEYRITMDLFKENMTDLVGEKLQLQFEKVGTTNKSNLTRAYNKNFKTSIIRNKNKKGKTKNSVNLNSQNIYDENGNPLNEITEEELDDNDESSELVLDVKGKTKNKGKSKSRSKSNDNKKTSKSKGKSKTNNGKNKGKKKSRKKKDEYEEDEYDFEDDED